MEVSESGSMGDDVLGGGMVEAVYIDLCGFTWMCYFCKNEVSA